MLGIRAENHAPLLLNEESVEDATSFTYLGSNVSHTGGADEDIKLRIGKARTAYHRLKKVWNSGQLHRRSKLRLFTSNVIPVLLFGCSSWIMTDKDERSLDTFVHKCEEDP